MATATERKLALPAKDGWVAVNVPEVDFKSYDGGRLYVPAHTIQVATRYPTFEDGELVAGRTQAQVAQFLREYNGTNELTGDQALKYLTLFQDEAVRDQLGREHTMFDENLERNDQPWRWGYVADFTRPHGDKTVEGVDGQRLVTRLVGYRLPGGDVEVGVTTIAPSGMVPALSRTALEKMIKAEGLKRLEQLRGREIFEKGDELVDVRNAIGHPQFALDHNARVGRDYVPHNYHVWTPSQDSGETVGVRTAGWCEHHDDRGCFAVILDCGAGRSVPNGSFPLVRGGGVKGNV